MPNAKHPITEALKLTSDFQSGFMRTAEESPEKGALALISYTVSLSNLGVPLEEAFRNACNQLGNDIPKDGHINQHVVKPSDDADETVHIMYRMEVKRNVAIVAAKTLGFFGKT